MIIHLASSRVVFDDREISMHYPSEQRILISAATYVK